MSSCRAKGLSTIPSICRTSGVTAAHKHTPVVSFTTWPLWTRAKSTICPSYIGYVILQDLLHAVERRKNPGSCRKSYRSYLSGRNLLSALPEL